MDVVEQILDESKFSSTPNPLLSSTPVPGDDSKVEDVAADISGDSDAKPNWQVPLKTL